MSHRARERAAAVPEQFRFHQRRRQGRHVDGVKSVREIALENQPPVVEGNVARQRDRPPHQFLARARRPRHQRDEVPHAREQRAAVPPDVVREHRLPNRGPQTPGGDGVPDDVLKRVVERPDDLVVAGEGVARLVPGRHLHARNPEVVVPLLQKPCVESPPAGCLKDRVVIAVVKPVQQTVFIQFQFLARGSGVLLQTLTQHIQHGLEALQDLARVAPDPPGIGDLETPHRIPFHKRSSQRKPLEFEQLGQEGIAVADVGYGFEETALSGGEQAHT